MEAQLPSGQLATEYGQWRARREAGHRLGKAGRPALQSSPHTKFLAKHLPAWSFQKGKIKKSSRSRRECQAATFPTTLPGLKGPPCAFPSVSGGTDMLSVWTAGKVTLWPLFHLVSPSPTR